ncbi:MAG: 1-(5-phosphoribosyl)-5-amino-4-imidazole-carboxylate carboxylase, partial [Treponema sp.]|nr:1-(5-phosphoribosyl)-5-amino-4-imidazole-carboxylate carboxylase [Treponema sp.]
MNSGTKKLLEDVRDGTVSVDDALAQIKQQPFMELGFAKPDLHRKARQGVAEVIYGAGKTAAQIVEIVRTMQDAGQGPVLITRMDGEKAALVGREIPLDYRAEARIGIVGDLPVPDGIGTVLVVTGGTSDIPVAEEAAVTAETLGNRVTRMYDVGV